MAPTYNNRLNGRSSASINHQNQFACEVCQRITTSQRQLNQHLGGKVHKTRVNQLENPTIISSAITTTIIVCEICKASYSASNISTHLQSSNHIRGIRFSSFVKARKEAEGNKNGVMVDSSDFGIIEYEIGAGSSPSFLRQIEIKISSNVDSTCLISSQLKYSGAKPLTYFRILSPTDYPINIDAGTTSLMLVFDPSDDSFGIYESFLELHFFQLNFGQYVIVRPIKAIVGNAKAIQDFGPTSPYVPKSKNIMERPSVVIPSIREIERGGIPWKIKLPKFEIPAFICTALTGSIKEQISAARQILMPFKLDIKNYTKYFSTILYIEGIQHEIDIQRYDLTSVPLSIHSYGKYNIYYLTVEGLAEKRPSVLPGDSINVRQSGSDASSWFQAYVIVCRNSEIGLRFATHFRPSSTALFDVQFSVPRIPTRRMLQVLDQKPLTTASILFPSEDAARYTIPPPEITKFNASFFSTSISNNERQASAVRSIVYKLHGTSPFVLFGPPGTGKTVTIVESIRHILRNNSSARILICTPSNSAADLIAMKLLNLGTNILFRLNAPSRERSQVPLRLLPHTYLFDDKFSLPTLKKVKSYGVIVSTCISASTLNGVGMNKGHFTAIFVDESGQSTEPETLIPLGLASNQTSVILVGDPKQLSPIIRSPIAGAFKLDRSMLARLMELSQYDPNIGGGSTVVKLLENYRNHPAILKYPNDQFYASELISKASHNVTNSLEGWKFWPNKNFPIIFHSIKGSDAQERHSPSFFNPLECLQVKKYVEDLRSARGLNIRGDDIGVISPYASQVKKLRVGLDAVNSGIKVGSVEEFQGQEKRIIIISTVRSNKQYLEFDKRFALGFLSNPKRFNVAVTRAQAGLIIVGDPEILALDFFWRNFLLYVHSNDGFRGQKWDATPYLDSKYDSAKAASDEMDELVREMNKTNLDEDIFGEYVRATESSWQRRE